MARISLKQRIKQGLFLLDGAMGTQLITRGFEPGKCNDYLNIQAPHIVSDIHRAYLKAGSDAVLTNTFGAHKFALARHGLANMVNKINTAGAQIAREAAGEQKYVLGNIGPSGDFLKPLGNLKPQDLKDAFAQQATALLSGGAEGFIIETMTALEEATIAVEAVKSVCDLPVFVSFAFDRTGKDFKTMMGVDVQLAVTKIVPLGIDAVGFNCGTALLDEYVELAEKVFSTVRDLSADVVILAEPNAGKPELLDGKTVYKVSPQDFAAAADKIHSAGINLIGGCCGTTPEHIKAVVTNIKRH